jgi:lysozyme family protein
MALLERRAEFVYFDGREERCCENVGHGINHPCRTWKRRSCHAAPSYVDQLWARFCCSSSTGDQHDGVIGAQTIGSARTSGPLIAAHFNGERLQFYTDLGTWPSYGKGWARRIATNLKNLEA